MSYFKFGVWSIVCVIKIKALGNVRFGDEMSFSIFKLDKKVNEIRFGRVV